MLRVRPEELETELSARLAIGQELLSREVSDLDEVRALREEFRTWYDVNEQLLRHRFTTDEVFKRHRLVAYASGSLRGTAYQELELVRKDISHAMQKLESVRQQLTYFDVEPSARSGEMRPSGGDRVFIGHGRSPLWRELKDFLADRLKLDWEEFNRVSPAGIATTERLSSMLENASVAFVVLTAEDEHTDGSEHARENVIHEAGLFQGRLGFPRAIVLLEEGCAEFSNIHGLGQIRFPKGNIAASFEQIRQVLEREGLVASS
jgi:predicted nucleotide-binding protein